MVWTNSVGKRFLDTSVIGDETVINLQSTKVYVFSDSVLCLGRILQHPDSSEAWKNRVAGARSEKSHRDYDAINGESTEFEWNIFPGFTALQPCDKINDLLSDLGTKHQKLSQEEFSPCQCSMTSLVTEKGNKDVCLANAGIVKVLARRFGIGQWSFIGPGSEKKLCSSENSPQGAWDDIAEQIFVGICRKWTSYFPCHNSVVQRYSQEQRTWKNCRYTSLQMWTPVDTIFRIIISVNQLSVYGAVAAVWRGNLRAIKIDQENLRFRWVNRLFSAKSRQKLLCKTKTPCMTKFFWQQYIQQIEFAFTRKQSE